MAKIAEQSGLVGIVNHRKEATTGAEFLRNQVDLLTYMGVFELVKTRAFCLDGISDHCIFMSPLLLLLKGKVITSSFL